MVIYIPHVFLENAEVAACLQFVAGISLAMFGDAISPALNINHQKQSGCHCNLNKGFKKSK